MLHIYDISRLRVNAEGLFRMSATLLELSLPKVLQLHSVTKDNKDFVGIVTKLRTRKAAVSCFELRQRQMLFFFFI